MSDGDRSWWAAALGADRDPGGSWVAAAPRPGPAGWCLQDLELHSYGARLVATAMRPAGGAGPGPVVVVPFYDVRSVLESPPAAGQEERRPGHRRPQGFAPALARHGLATLAVPWWFEQRAAGDPRTAGATDLAGRYGPAAAEHERQWPVTGLGRAVADLMLATDALLDQPWVDPAAIGAFGHSLGGKLALHLAALDDRVQAAAVHEPGLGFAFSNWSDPWYLGQRVPADRDQDDLLALVAPRRLLLSGGGASDGAHNRHLVEAARAAWPDGSGLDVLYHQNGHPVPPAVLDDLARWLRRSLGS